MKKVFLTLLAALCLFNAEAQLKTPAPSPTQTVKQDFGLGSIELSYSRPVMKGRKIFGDLVPFGNVWRTGANSATLVTFSDEVTIGGKKVPAGKYGLLSIPNKDSWTLIISKQLDVTSPAAYKAESDVVRVDVNTMKLEEKTESFTIQFANVKPTSCELHIMWENTAVSLPISTDVDKKVMTQIDQLMNKDTRPYFNAAMYKAVEMNAAAFWIHHQRANCLAKLGKKAEAKAAAEKSKELAAAAKNDDYVKLNEKLLADLNK